MFDDSLRRLKDRLAWPVAVRLAWLPPLALSLPGLLVGLGAAWLAAQQLYGAALLAWLLNRTIDALDGTVARAAGRQSDLGGYLDLLFDFLVYAAVPIGLVWGAPAPERYLALALLLAGFYLNATSWLYLAAVLEKRQHGTAARGELTTVTMPRAIIGGLETIALYCLYLIWPAQLLWWFGLTIALVLIAIGQRLIWSIRYL